MAKKREFPPDRWGRLRCGCDAFTEIEDFGKHKADFFRMFLELPNGIPSHANGIPSHDTFGRVFRLLESRGSLRGNRKRAGWDNEFLLQVLATHGD